MITKPWLGKYYQEWRKIESRKQMAKSFKKKAGTSILDAAKKQKAHSVEEIKSKLIIKEELKQFIPPLTKEEFAQLEDNLLVEGCRDPLVVWKKGEEYILVDGHNRHRICTKHGIDFRIEEKSFGGLAEVKDWMINNQLGKRNLTEDAKSYLRGEQYKNEKKGRGGDRKSSPQNDDLKLKTKDRLANQHKVSSSTIERDEKYANAIDKITSQNSELRWRILNREINIPKADLIKASELKPNQVKQFTSAIEKNEDYKSILKPKTTAKKEVSDLEKLAQEIGTLASRIAKSGDKEELARLEGMFSEFRSKIS